MRRDRLGSGAAVARCVQLTIKLRNIHKISPLLASRNGIKAIARCPGAVERRDYVKHATSATVAPETITGIDYRNIGDSLIDGSRADAIENNKQFV